MEFLALMGQESAEPTSLNNFSFSTLWLISLGPGSTVGGGGGKLKKMGLNRKNIGESSEPCGVLGREKGRLSLEKCL